MRGALGTSAVHMRAYQQFCATVARDGPEVAWWRLTLLSSFSGAYRRRMSAALGS